MATPTAWLPSFQVNTGPAETGTQVDPKIFGLSNGGFAVIYTENANGLIGTSAGTDIVATLYDAEGNITRQSFQLNAQFRTDDEHDFDVTATHDGFAIAFVDSLIGSPTQTGIRYERYDLEGNLVDSKSIRNDFSNSVELSNPQLSANLGASNDDVLVSFTKTTDGDSNVYARVIDQNDVIGTEFAVAQNSSDQDELGDVAVLRNGNFVTVYDEDDSGTPGIEFSIRTAAGNAVGAPSVNVASGATDPAVSGLADGGFVVAYVKDQDVVSRIYSASGAFETEITVAAGNNLQNEPAVIGLRDGSFVVFWDDDSTGSVNGRLFTSAGTPDGLTFSVDTGGITLTSLDVGVTADGRLLFTWAENGGEISTSVWDPRGETINPDDYQFGTANFLKTNTITTSQNGSTVLPGFKGDTILGQEGDDTIYSSGSGAFYGGGGDDTVFANASTTILDFELLDGGAGVDTLYTAGFLGDYTINLTTGKARFADNFPEVESFVNFENIITGFGNDIVTGTAGANVIETGNGDDEVFAGGGNDTIRGGLGNDRLLGQAGNDTFFGDDGNDTLNGGDGNDLILGGEGNDLVYAGVGNDIVDGGDGDDTVSGEAGNDLIGGGAGNDILRGGDGADTISGGTGDDIAYGGGDNDTLNGASGDDSLNGSGGDDVIDGGDGNDILAGDTGSDEVFGSDGDDILRGGGGNDTLEGGNDNDLLFGASGEDMLSGGNGDDTLDGGTQADILEGDAGDDILRGGDGFDILEGGIGNDVLAGGNGNDVLVGGFGQDTLRGQGQNDTFVFNSSLESTFAASDLIDGIDGIGAAGGDIIDLSAMDANLLVNGNNAFTFLGEQTTADALDFGAGALWVENVGTQTRLYANLDNDDAIEFAVQINDGAGVSAATYELGDFIL